MSGAADEIDDFADYAVLIEAHRARFERADILVALAAANRDPARWENPAEFRLNRERIKEHVAFGRAAHTCIGNPLARPEIASSTTGRPISSGVSRSCTSS